MSFAFQCCTKSSVLVSTSKKRGNTHNVDDMDDDENLATPRQESIHRGRRESAPSSGNVNDSTTQNIPQDQSKTEHTRRISFADAVDIPKADQLRFSTTSTIEISASSSGSTDNLGRPTSSSTVKCEDLLVRKYSRHLNQHHENSAYSIFSAESETEAQDRRKQYIENQNIDMSNKSIEEQTLQEKIVDWCSRYVIQSRLQQVQIFSRRDSNGTSEEYNKAIDRNIRLVNWVHSFLELDPRRQIHNYFTEVARVGGALANPLADAPLHIIRGFRRTASFSVWRPTSPEAISLMMTGAATGKGLEVKGKSAKCGRLSGLVPFIQIHEEKHRHIGKLGLSQDGRIIIYYKTKKLREDALKDFNRVAKDMKRLKKVVRWEVTNWKIYRRNECGYGLDVPERVLYEACVFRQDFTRQGDLETGRPSDPNFHVMNFECMRNYKGDGPRPVVYQLDEDLPLRPQTMVVAYEENYTVVPVASDFDCFLIGTRGVLYDEAMSTKIIDLMKWMIESIENILKNPKNKEKRWSSCWFEAMRKADERSKILMPQFGFSDPKSYEIMEGAVERFAHNRNGAVRHGAECFNYKFPQEVDDKLLVVADRGEVNGNDNRLFKYMGPSELQEFMMEKLDDGFVFPLNPKWILADRGWKKVYDKMLSSTDPNVQKSLNVWYPKSSGVREMIERVHKRFPSGYASNSNEPKMEGTEELDLLEQKLKRQEILQRAMAKIRMLRSMGLLKEVQKAQM